MRIGILGVALIAILALAPSAKAQQQAADLCNNKGGKYSHEQRIKGCTTLIQARIFGKPLAAAYRSRGIAYDEQYDFDNAVADLTQAIKIDSKDAYTYAARASVYWNNRHTDKSRSELAIFDLNEAIRVNPRYHDAYRMRGEIYYEQGGKDALALQDLNQALKLFPFSARALELRGHIYSKAGELEPKEYARAALDYEKAIVIDEKNPDNDSRHRSVAYLHFYLGNFDVAAQSFSEGVSLFKRKKHDEFVASLWQPMALWIHVSLARHEARDPGRIAVTSRGDLERRISDLAKDGLYSKLAEMYFGRLTPNEALAAAKNDRERCDGNFFIGQWHILRNERDAAIDRLKSVTPACGKTNPVQVAARNELKIRLGYKEAVPAQATSSTVQPPAADCAAAETHWKSAETLGILAGYEDHLARFPNCAFATLARAKIEALTKK